MFEIQLFRVKWNKVQPGTDEKYKVPIKPELICLRHRWWASEKGLVTKSTQNSLFAKGSGREDQFSSSKWVPEGIISGGWWTSGGKIRQGGGGEKQFKNLCLQS